jgi:cyclic pyranopterin phosphate synthase
MSQLTHLDSDGRARMVDVTAKAVTQRQATARGHVVMQPETVQLIIAGNMKKGDVLTVAELAGVMAAKKTSDLIPLCHPLPVTNIQVSVRPNPDHSRVDIEATVTVNHKTGVEMEALTAVTVAALTIYDMAKAVDRHMRIEGVRVVQKSGGRSGDWSVEDED